MSNNAEEGQSVSAAGLVVLSNNNHVCCLSAFLNDACFLFLWPGLAPQVCCSRCISSHLGLLFFSTVIIPTWHFLGKVTPPPHNLPPTCPCTRLSPSSYFPLLPLLIHPHLTTVTMLTELICAPVNICSSAAILLASIEPFLPLICCLHLPILSSVLRFFPISFPQMRCCPERSVYSLSPATVQVLGKEK